MVWCPHFSIKVRRIPMIIKDNEWVDIDTPTGKMRSYIFRQAAEGKYPGLLLYSEIFQVTGPIRRTPARMAGGGFVVMLPGIYHDFGPPGSVLALDERGAVGANDLRI